MYAKRARHLSRQPTLAQRTAEDQSMIHRDETSGADSAAEETEKTNESDDVSPRATPPSVRDVVGRRGYDEAEDETRTETENH